MEKNEWTDAKIRPWEAVLEQLIETGPGNIASVFARAFDLTMRDASASAVPGPGWTRAPPERRGYANATLPKRVDTPAGTVTVQVPKTAGHEGEPCLTAIAGTRSTIGARVRQGKRSPGPFSALPLCWLSPRCTSRACQRATWRLSWPSSASCACHRRRSAGPPSCWMRSWSAGSDRPLGEITYLIPDARYEKMRHGGVVLDVAVLSAIGIGPDERRRVPGVSVALSEAEVHWRGVRREASPRGLFSDRPHSREPRRPRHALSEHSETWYSSSRTTTAACAPFVAVLGGSAASSTWPGTRSITPPVPRPPGASADS